MTGPSTRPPKDVRVGAALAGNPVHRAAFHRSSRPSIPDAAFLAGLSVDRREASWRRVLAAADSELLLGCDLDGSIVGFASIGASRDADAPPGRGELWAGYIHPQWWSRGRGSELWHAAHARLRLQGFSSVSLLEKSA